MIRTVPAAVPSAPGWKVFRDRGASAEELLRAFGAFEPPIDVERLARSLDVRIEERWGVPNSGRVDSDERSATITLNSSNHPLRKRFTIAHELGHLMLHPLGRLHRDEEDAGSPFEVQANRFAADLLMPLAIVDRYAALYRGNVRRLADVFNVSEPAMRIRLGKLVGW